MKTMTVGDLKSRFSEVLKEVQQGEEIAVAFGQKREIVAYLIPKSSRKPVKRQLGLLRGKGTALFTGESSMTEEDFLSA